MESDLARMLVVWFCCPSYQVRLIWEGVGIIQMERMIFQLRTSGEVRIPVPLAWFVSS